MNEMCKNCNYCELEDMKFPDGHKRPIHHCKLTNTLRNPNASCEYYNKDISDLDMCYNCKHYIGGGDWGLSCRKDYYKLVQFNSKTCEHFESDKEKQ